MVDVQPRWKNAVTRRTADRERRRYSKWRTEQLAARPWCEAGRLLPSGVCRTVSDQLHHRRRRSRGGALVSTVNTVAICEPCHTWVHAHPHRAGALGLLLRDGHPEWEACG